MSEVTIQINDEIASNLALFCKRATYEDVLRRTDNGSNEDQAYSILNGLSVIAKALGEQGIDIR